MQIVIHAQINEATHSYIGRASCGCIHAARFDEGDRDTAHAVADFIKHGLTIERVTHDYVRTYFGHNCEICNPPQPEQTAML